MRNFYDTKMITAHCSSCGAENPSNDEGYTSCCGKRVCSGGAEDRYGTPENYVWACCWGMAEGKFAKLGKTLTPGMCRL